MKPTCAIEGCDSPVHCRGWCNKHDWRFRAHGDATVVPIRTLPKVERFWAYVNKTTPNGCWEWTASTRYGYGRFGDTRSPKGWVFAHRLAYELVVGPIPDGLILDHLCRNRACVNPAHLEPVTNRENILRGNSFSALNARQTHCIHGHPFDEANTYHHRNGHRQCRACRARHEAKRRARQKAEATTDVCAERYGRGPLVVAT